MNKLASILFLLLLPTVESKALDISVVGTPTTSPYIPNSKGTAPHVALPIQLKWIDPPPDFVGSDFDIFLDEGLYTFTRGYPTIPPLDDGGHVGHNERNRGGAEISDSPTYQRVRTLRLTSGAPPEGSIFYFYPPEVSGTYRLVMSCSRCVHNSYLNPSIVNVVVKVPNLVSLDSVPNSWHLIGSNSQHPDNHYGTARTLSFLTDARSRWKNVFPNAPEWAINDLSLKWGGLFETARDVKTKKLIEWAPPHHDHRQGTSIDIDHFAVPESDRTKLFSFLRGDLTKISESPERSEQLPTVQKVYYGTAGHFTHYHVEVPQ